MTPEPLVTEASEYRGYRLTAFQSYDGWTVMITGDIKSKSTFVSDDTYEAVVQRAKDLIDRRLPSEPPPSR
jgi:hypothetical protein